MFYMYQIGWYVFGTFVAFVAALLFWKKGRAQVKGRTLELGLGLKLTGAGAIFVAVLLVFHLINPLKPLSDYKKVIIVFSNEKISEPTSDKVQYTLKPSEFGEDIEFDSNELSIEMIPWDYVYDFLPALDDKSFESREAIPIGRYMVRFTFRDTGESKIFTITIPESK